jgi:hypothetical protein
MTLRMNAISLRSKQHSCTYWWVGQNLKHTYNNHHKDSATLNCSLETTILQMFSAV